MTVCCRLTGPGRSAIAVIGVHGPRANEIIGGCFRPATARPLQPGQVRYGRWDGDGSETESSTSGAAATSGAAIAAESVVLVPLENDRVEIHCHGGPAAVERILNDLNQLGAERIDAETWVALESPSPLIAEAELVLSQCVTERTAGIALDQVRGALLDWASQKIDQLTSALARQTPEPSTLAAVRLSCQNVLQYADLGCRLTQPFKVVLFGPPNVGKSSLINALLGYERSITYNQPGTTRDVLSAETAVNGLPVQLMDTAGLRDSEQSIEREGVLRARAAAETADLLIWVQQVEPAGAGDDVSALRLSADVRCKQLQVLNKVDLLPSGHHAGLLEDGVLGVSATQPLGIDDLQDAISRALAGNFPPSGCPVPLNNRQVDCLRKAVDSPDLAGCRGQLQRLIDAEQSA